MAFGNISGYAQKLNDVKSQPCVNQSTGQSFRGHVKRDQHGIYVTPGSATVSIGDTIHAEGDNQFFMVEDIPKTTDGIERLPVSECWLFADVQRPDGTEFHNIIFNVPVISSGHAFITAPRYGIHQGDKLLLSTGDQFRVSGVSLSAKPLLLVEVVQIVVTP